jgi:hypothetical protein
MLDRMHPEHHGYSKGISRVLFIYLLFNEAFRISGGIPSNVIIIIIIIIKKPKQGRTEAF